MKVGARNEVFRHVVGDFKKYSLVPSGRKDPQHHDEHVVLCDAEADAVAEPTAVETPAEELADYDDGSADPLHLFSTDPVAAPSVVAICG